MKRAFLTTVVILLLTPGVLASTWQEVLSAASQKSNEIKSARKQLDAYQWTYYKSFSNFLPQVSANLSAGESTNSGGTANSYSYGLSASQAIFKGLVNYYNFLSAGINYDFYRANLQLASADAYYTLRLAFIDLYLAQQNVGVREQIRQSRAENERMIKLLYESGKEDKGNYLRTQAQLNDASYSVISAKRQLELARVKLAQLIDADVTAAEGKLVSGSIAPPDIDWLAKNAPSYLMAKDQLDLADIAEKNTVSEFLPSISLNGSVQRSGSDWPPSADSKSVSLNVSLPIFPGGSNFADRASFGLLLEKAHEDFAQSQKDIYFSIKEAYENLQDAIEGYGVQKQYLDASAERAKIAQVKYLDGLISYSDWDLIQNEYISNQISLLGYNRIALAAEASWYKSYGGWVK